MSNDLVLYQAPGALAPREGMPGSRGILRHVPVLAVSKETAKELATLIAEPISDPTPLFKCSLAGLAGNIRFLLSEREKNRLALCQQLGVAKMRLAAGDGGDRITWKVWCKRFVISPYGNPYPQTSCDKWAQVGMAPDMQAAYRAYMAEQREKRERDPRQMSTTKVRYERSRLEAVMGPAMTQAVLDTALPAPLPKCFLKKHPERAADGEIALQVNVLMHAWEAACDQARNQFLHLINARAL